MIDINVGDYIKTKCDMRVMHNDHAISISKGDILIVLSLGTSELTITDEDYCIELLHPVHGLVWDAYANRNRSDDELKELYFVDFELIK